MSWSRLTIGIVGSIAVSGALAQQSANKHSKPAPATQEQQPMPAASTATTDPLLSPPPFSPVRWQSDAPISAYLPNEAAKVYEWVTAQIAAVPGMPDKFSTSAESLAYQSAVAEKLAGMGALAILFNCKKNYDADRQEYEVKVGGGSIVDAADLYLNPETLQLRKISLNEGRFIKDTYIGRDFFGRSAEITRTVGEFVAFTFSADANNDPSGIWKPWSNPFTDMGKPVPYTAKNGDYLMRVTMPPVEARQQDKNISCLAVVTISPPGSYRFVTRTGPTRGFATEYAFRISALMGTLDLLAVVNTANNQIYAKATRAGFTGK